MKYAVLAAILAAFFVTACGSDNPSTANVKATEQPAQKQQTPAPTQTTPDPPDSDNDGTPNADDFDPNDPGIQTKSDSKDCEVLGIDRKGLREGTCITQGQSVKITNRDHALTLPQMNVRLNSIEAVSSIHREYESPLVGSYVIANVSITNKLDDPVEVDASDMFSLSVEGKTSNPNFNAMNNGDNPLIYEEIQPDETATGDVIFKVAASHVDGLAKDGNLSVLQFSDADAFSDKPEHTIGVFRTYH